MNTIRVDNDFYTIMFYRDPDTSFDSMHANFKIHGIETCFNSWNHKDPRSDHTSKAQDTILRDPWVLSMENGKTGIIISQ